MLKQSREPMKADEAPKSLKRTRKIEVKTKRDDVQVWSRTSYSLRPTPAAN